MKYKNDKEFYLVLKKDERDIELEVSAKEALLITAELADYVTLLCNDDGEVLYAGKDYNLNMTEDARTFVSYFKNDVQKAPAHEDINDCEIKFDDLSEDDIEDEPAINEWDPRYLIKYRGVTTMGWSARTENCLKRADILFLGQLLQKTPEDIIRIRNLGRRSLKEIKDSLHSLGFSLKDEELSFEDKVQICAARFKEDVIHMHCECCPLREDSCNCFYNESIKNTHAVAEALGITKDSDEGGYEAHYSPEDLEGAE